ncbi:MAG: hypothetical protein ACOC8K_08030, partial [Gemmatimonadota bacterium]
MFFGAHDLVGLWLGALLLGGLVHAAAAHAQLPPDEEWATRTTEHLRVTYPAEHPRLGERTAVRAEAAYRLLADVLADPPSGRIDVVVSDHTDQSNGWATVFPTNRAVVVAAPPMDGISLAHFDDWLDLVLVHELSHVFHLDEPGTPGAVVRAVFGRIPLVWPTFPGLLTPTWTTEGLATWYESGLTSAGRNRGSYFEMILRTAALEGEFEDPGRAAGSSPVWPHGDRPYVYGGGFFENLVRRAEAGGGDVSGRDSPDGSGSTQSTQAADRAAEEPAREEGPPPGIPEFVQRYADRWIPFRLGASAEDAFGEDVGAAWEAWRAERRDEALA